MDFAPLIAALAPQSPVVERFDLIGVDPRGVGASTPAVDCYTDAEREDGALSEMYYVDDWTAEETRQWTRQCAERPPKPAPYGDHRHYRPGPAASRHPGGRSASQRGMRDATVVRCRLPAQDSTR